MTIYLDSEYKCHLETDGTMQPYETDVFDDKCKAYIEGYRLVPEGETWTREDGATFTGLMVVPWMDYSVLAAAQAGYEESLAAAMAAYEEGVNAAYE